jgi:hypothetical protein
MAHRPASRLGTALALLGAAALGGCADPAAPPTPAGAIPVASAEPAPACTAEYAAVLDLAALARSYGAGAPVFMDALGAQFDRLDECLTAHNAAGLHDANGRRPDGGAMPIAARRP